MGNLITRPDGSIDHSMYTAFHTTMSLDGILDLDEARKVGESWRAAAMHNADDKSEAPCRR